MSLSLPFSARVSLPVLCFSPVRHCPRDTLQWSTSLPFLCSRLCFTTVTQTQSCHTAHTAFALTSSWQAVPSFITRLLHLPVTSVTSAFPCWPSLGPAPPPAWPHFHASAAPRHLCHGLYELRISLVQASAVSACPLSYFSSDGRPHLCHSVLEVCSASLHSGKLLGYCWDHLPRKCRECSEDPQLGFVNLCVRAKNPNILETVIRICVSFYFVHTRIHIPPFHAVHTHGGIVRIRPFVHLSVLCPYVNMCVTFKKSFEFSLSL